MSGSYVVIVWSYNFWGKSWFIKAKPNSRFWKVWNALDFVVQDTKQGLCSVWNHVSHVGLELKSEKLKSWRFLLNVKNIILFQVFSQMGSIAPLQKLQKKSVHALKRALSESQLVDLRMGNLCSMGASAAAKKVKIKPENIM